MADHDWYEGRIIVRNEYPGDYLQHALEDLKRKAGRELLEKLLENPGYKTIRVTTGQRPHKTNDPFSFPGRGETEYYISAELIGVNERNVEIFRYEDLPLSALSGSAWGELKSRVKRGIKQAWRKVTGRR
jgi:hypothetical protein